MQAADFDDDGNLDLAVTKQFSGEVSVLLGDGALNFTELTPIPVSGEVNALAIGDLNQDGADDLILGNNAAMATTVLLGDPAAVLAYSPPPGNFTALTKKPDGSFARRLKNGTVIDYDPSGRLTGIAWPNTVTSTLAYDPDGRLSGIDHDRGAATLLSVGYTYDASGQIDSIDDNGTSKSYAYDDLFQLTAGGSAAQPEAYSYDDEGNWVASHLSASHLVDDANRLTEDDGFCYAYDGSGNLSVRTAKVAGACTGDITLYGYDSLDRLTRIDRPDSSVVTYAYDVFGRRIEKDVAGAVTRYVYDGDDIALEFDGANALQARYAHGAAIDQPLAMERGGIEYYYQRDHLGSIRLLTDGAGNIANAYEHDSFGRRLAASEAVANPFTFTGREFDPESGLYHYRFRAYDPEAGRFLQEDPLGFGGGDTNLYAP